MKKILLIDDDSDLRTITRYGLESAGFEVHTACDGVEGLVQALNIRPDVIVTDVMMHNLDGCAMIAGFRDKPELKSTPIVVLTGMRELKDRFGEYSLITFMEKPFQITELIERLKFLTR